MEGVALNTLFQGAYAGRTVLVTGHTGFKGSWLTLWLHALGAKVVGYALPPPGTPNHFQWLPQLCHSIIGDVRDPEHLAAVMREHAPEAVFHLAAQPLVRHSYREPVETYATNVMGTVHLLEACRATPSVKAVVVITSDKCYQNNEWVWGYRESDPMGGHDPYSSSKGCTELVVQAYGHSYFHAQAGKQAPLLASARAGNVIGGGDWAQDRLIPDLVRAAVKGETTPIRSPRAVRPWQHVLEPLSGYLHLGGKLLAGERSFAGAWNFGPDPEGAVTVGEVARQAAEVWERIAYRIEDSGQHPHEAGLLQLDCSKARMLLPWHPCWSSAEAIRRTILWYRRYYENQPGMSLEDLHDYVAEATRQKASWTRVPPSS